MQEFRDKIIFIDTEKWQQWLVLPARCTTRIGLVGLANILYVTGRAGGAGGAGGYFVCDWWGWWGWRIFCM